MEIENKKVSEDKKKKDNIKAKKEKKKMEYDDDDDDDDEEDGENDDDDDDDDDFDFDEDEEEEERNNQKFNLKSFSKQPTIILSEGVSVILVLKEKEMDESFDAEKYGFDFLEERKRLANVELEKLKIEIEELDSELNENENNDKNDKNNNEVNENKIQNVTKTEKPAKTEEQIFKSIVKEIEKENKRKTEERESIANFLLFSVLNGEIDIRMKFSDAKKKDKNEINNGLNYDDVTFSIQKIESDKNESNFFDEKEVADVLKITNEIKKSNSKGKESEVDQNDDFLSLIISSKVVMMSSKTENMPQVKEMKKNSNSNSDSDKNSDEEIVSKIEIKKAEKDAASLSTQNRNEVDFFANPESVLGPRIVRAFEVISQIFKLSNLILQCIFLLIS